MIIAGLAFIVVGYALFYWGVHHWFGHRYSLWTLLGFQSLFAGTKNNPTQVPKN